MWIQRSLEERGIHNLYIFSETGSCLYGKSFTGKYDHIEKQLISGFVTALRHFTTTTIGKPISHVVMNDLKLVILKKKSYFYGLLCSYFENEAILEDVISKIDLVFGEFLIKENVHVNLGECISYKRFSPLVDRLMEEIFTSKSDLDKEGQIIKELEHFNKNYHTQGFALYTDKGNLIYTSIPHNELNNTLKEIDFRVKIHNNSILKLFYTSKNNDMIISEFVEDTYLIILFLPPSVDLGTSGTYLKRAVEIIKSCI